MEADLAPAKFGQAAVNLHKKYLLKKTEYKWEGCRLYK